jgi:hypothetical protein
LGNFFRLRQIKQERNNKTTLPELAVTTDVRRAKRRLQPFDGSALRAKTSTGLFGAFAPWAKTSAGLFGAFAPWTKASPPLFESFARRKRLSLSGKGNKKAAHAKNM